MRTRGSRTEDGEWRTRSVLDCGGRDAAFKSGVALRLPPHGETRWQFVVLFGFIVLESAFCLTTRGQSYSVDWYKIAGGGGTSTGGVYAVSGTIGQPDAGGPLTGGSYSLTGGFWSVIAAVQTPGAPYLTITRSGGTVTVSWPLSADGWVLEYTNTLSQTSSSWPQISPPYQTDGANLQFTEPAPSGNRFYRLHKP